jgi:hypothetical protein
MGTLAMNGPFAPWCVDYHRTMAATFAVGNAVKRSASILELAKDFWSLNRTFRSLLSDLEMETQIPSEYVPQLHERLSDLHRTVNRTLDLSRKNGFGNRTLINRSMNSLQSCNNRLEDFVERLALSMNSAIATEGAEAMSEYKRGETVSLTSLI